MTKDSAKKIINFVLAWCGVWCLYDQGNINSRLVLDHTKERPMKKIGVACTIGCLFAAGLLHADIIALYDFPGDPPAVSSSVSSPLADAGDIEAVAAHNIIYSESMETGRLRVRNVTSTEAVYATSLAGALADGLYVTFTIEPNAPLDFLGVSLDFSRQRGQTDADRDFTGNLALFSDIDGFAETNSLHQASVSSGNFFNLPGNFDADLSGLSQFQNVDEAVEFRLYYWLTDIDIYDPPIGGLVPDGIVMDNITVSAIPEPSVTALFLLGLLSLLAVRRAGRS